jgi:mannosyltransferase
VARELMNASVVWADFLNQRMLAFLETSRQRWRHELQAQLQQRVREQGMSERIRFLGEIAPDQVGQWYRNVLITVACPRYEPFGLTPLEGMACGCAVVASDTGAFRTIVDEGVTGHVVPTEDVEALADRLRALMRDPLRTAEMGRRGRERVEQSFSVEREAQGILAVYSHIWHKSGWVSPSATAAP